MNTVMRASYDGGSSNPNSSGNTTLNRSLNDLDTSRKSEIETPKQQNRLQISFYVDIKREKTYKISLQVFSKNAKALTEPYEYSDSTSYNFVATLPKDADYTMIKIGQLLDTLYVTCKKHVVYNLNDRTTTTDEFNSRPFGNYPTVKHKLKKIKN